jgi:hypothetical protein
MDFVILSEAKNLKSFLGSRALALEESNQRCFAPLNMTARFDLRLV